MHLVIRLSLRRECGLDLDLSDIPIESLVPEQLESVASPDDFMAQLPQYDGAMQAQMAAAEAAGECLRFVGEGQTVLSHPC